MRLPSVEAKCPAYRTYGQLDGVYELRVFIEGTRVATFEFTVGAGAPAAPYRASSRGL